MRFPHPLRARWREAVVASRADGGVSVLGVLVALLVGVLVAVVLRAGPESAALDGRVAPPPSHRDQPGAPAN